MDVLDLPLADGLILVTISGGGGGGERERGLTDLLIGYEVILPMKNFKTKFPSS